MNTFIMKWHQTGHPERSFSCRVSVDKLGLSASSAIRVFSDRLGAELDARPGSRAYGTVWNRVAYLVEACVHNSNGPRPWNESSEVLGLSVTVNLNSICSGALKSGALVESVYGEVYLLGSCRTRSPESDMLYYDMTRLSDGADHQMSEEIILATCTLYEGPMHGQPKLPK